MCHYFHIIQIKKIALHLILYINGVSCHMHTNNEFKSQPSWPEAEMLILGRDIKWKFDNILCLRFAFCAQTEWYIANIDISHKSSFSHFQCILWNFTNFLSFSAINYCLLCFSLVSFIVFTSESLLS